MGAAAKLHQETWRSVMMMDFFSALHISEGGGGQQIFKWEYSYQLP